MYKISYTMDNKLTKVVDLSGNKTKVVDLSGNKTKVKSKFSPHVTKQDFLEYKIFQRGFSTIPAWFHTNDTKADEIMTKFNELAKHYK